MQREAGRMTAPRAGVACMFLLSGCAFQPGTAPGGPGFFAGLWHGLTAIVALAASLFLPIRPYAYPNTGFWYDAGFVSGFTVTLLALLLASLPRIGGFIVSRF